MTMSFNLLNKGQLLSKSLFTITLNDQFYIRVCCFLRVIAG